MDVLELLNHYRLEKLDEKEQELFTYFAYAYAIENDENNHPYFHISLFSKISRINVLDFIITYKGAINYSCQICREKQPCYHFSILATKLLTDELEQIKALAERFNYEVNDVDRRDGSNAASAGLKGGTKAVYYGSRNNILYLGGDVITKIDGIAITSLAEYYSALESKKPGDVVNVVVHRNKKDVTLKITLAE